MQNKTKAATALAVSAICAAGTLPVSPVINFITAQAGEIIVGFLNHGFIAATIGGLADWFAVTALFHKPLGIKYRTEILKRNRQRYTDAIVEYVERDLLNTENIMETIRQENTAKLLIDYFENSNGREKVHVLCREILGELFHKTDSREIAKTLTPILENEIKNFDANKILDTAVKVITAEKHSRKILTVLLETVEKILKSEHMQEAILAKISDLLEAYEGDSAGRALVLSSLNLTAEKILGILNENVEEKISETKSLLNLTGMVDAETADASKKILDAFNNFVKNSASGFDKNNIQDEFKKVFSDKFDMANYIKTWLDVNIKGEDDPELLEKIQRQYTANPQHGRIMKIDRKDPVWHKPLDNLIDEKIDEFIENTAQQEKLDNFIKNLAENLLTEYHDQIPNLIRERLDKLSDDEMTEFVENKVSDDLQMIRINGSICGGVAGMFLYGISLLIEKIIG